MDFNCDKFKLLNCVLHCSYQLLNFKCCEPLSPLCVAREVSDWMTPPPGAKTSIFCQLREQQHLEYRPYMK